MNLTLKVWRQKNAKARGRFVTYEAKNISPDLSFLEITAGFKSRKVFKP